MPERYQQVLSIVGTLAIIGFHCQLPWLAAGWTAVVLFFVLAAARMAPAMGRDEAVLDYGMRRIKRLAPEYVCIYVACLFALLWWPTASLRLFAVTAPVFLHNWTRAFSEPSYQDLLFGPLWFVGALLQLQLFAVALRHSLGRLSASTLFGAAVVLGVSTRLVAALAVGIDRGEIPVRYAEAIYWTPFAHVESIAAGYLVGRGDWRALGRWMPAVIALTAALGAIVLVLIPHLPSATLGYRLGLSTHYQFLWGYPILAVAAASVVAPTNLLRQWVECTSFPLPAEKLIAFLANLNYGVYFFHGAWIVFATNGLGFGHGRLLFLFTIASSVLCAWTFQIAQKQLARFGEAFAPKRLGQT
jgi:hypothetical protein